jgi:hypothetical protein
MKVVTVIFHTYVEYTDDEWEDKIGDALADAGVDIAPVQVDQEEV